MNVTQAMIARRSCRSFTSQLVPESTVRDILETARFAPSGGNLQPWHVYVLAGVPLHDLLQDVGQRMADTPRGEGSQYRIYPKDLKEPYYARRFKCGEDLYSTLKIAREDKAGRLSQFKNNFRLFGAPVGLFFYLDRQMQPGQWSDVGMFIQSVMLAATEHGLATCAQEAWAAWFQTVTRHTGAPNELMLFCGMALGYADEDAPINSLRTDRATVDEIACFSGF